MSSTSPSDPSEDHFELPILEEPLLPHDDLPRISYNEWMDEIAERTRAYFALPLESRPPRRTPVPKRFVMED